MSDWKTSRNAALDAWRESLTLEQRQEFEAFVAERKAQREVRRAARLARNALRATSEAQIVRSVLSGLSTDEIAIEFGMKPREVRRCCSRLGIARMSPSYRRIPCGAIPVAMRDKLRQIAAERGEDEATTVELLLTYVLEDEAVLARRLLRLSPALKRAA